MSLARSISRSLGRSIAREIERGLKRKSTYGRLQAKAASRPESTQVQTPHGLVWMSPIEMRLYEAMRQDGLDPVPQYHIQGYYADFAFPDVRLVVEADGAIHNDAVHKAHDRKRDWVLRRGGWTVKHFHGTTIYRKAGSCSFVVKMEVEGRRRQLALAARERRRQARRDALAGPVRALRGLLTRDRRTESSRRDGVTECEHREPR